MSRSWFDDPKQLIRADKVHNFWPSSSQTPAERVNSASRFVVYATTILYVIRRDLRLFVLGATVLGVLYFMYKSDMVENPVGRQTFPDNEQLGVQLPTADNPMANVLLTDYTDNPNRPPAAWYPSVKAYVNANLEQTFKFDAGRSRTPLPEHQQRFAARQWASMPVTTIPGDQTAFAEACYGEKFRPMCKDGATGVCNPNARGVQLEAFAGIGGDGDKRSGMHGGTPFS